MAPRCGWFAGKSGDSPGNRGPATSDGSPGAAPHGRRDLRWCGPGVTTFGDLVIRDALAGRQDSLRVASPGTRVRKAGNYRGRTSRVAARGKMIESRQSCTVAPARSQRARRLGRGVGGHSSRLRDRQKPFSLQGWRVAAGARPNLCRATSGSSAANLARLQHPFCITLRSAYSSGTGKPDFPGRDATACASANAHEVARRAGRPYNRNP